jgi:hypothetical protein
VRHTSIRWWEKRRFVGRIFRICVRSLYIHR